MSVLNAVYVDGESTLPQARPTLAVEPVYVDGESGKLPILAWLVGGNQFARPISDISVGGWLNELGSGTNLYQSIDEATASDTDYIRSGATPVDDTAIFILTPLATPDAGTVTMRIRARSM